MTTGLEGGGGGGNKLLIVRGDDRKILGKDEGYLNEFECIGESRVNQLLESRRWSTMSMAPEAAGRKAEL